MSVVRLSAHSDNPFFGVGGETSRFPHTPLHMLTRTRTRA